jgi:flagellar biosynthesis protein FlhA
VKPYLNQKGELPAWLMDASVEQMVEGAVQHTEQNSILALSPQVVRDILNRIERKVEKPEMPVAVITGSGARHFLRQIVEPSLGNLFFLSHNEVPTGVKVLSLGVI